MFFTDVLNSSSALDSWRTYGRIGIFAVYVLLIVLFAVLILKKKIGVKIGAVVVGCCVCLTALMFVTVEKPSVFVACDMDEFFDEMENMLTYENINVEKTTEDCLVWSWYNETEDVQCYVTVKERAPGEGIAKDAPTRNVISGTDGKYEYLFAPMFAGSKEGFFGGCKYLGKLFIQSDDLYVNVSYRTTGDDFIDYISAIYPILYTKEISIMELLDKTDGVLFF